jgi:hypothetical protein
MHIDVELFVRLKFEPIVGELKGLFVNVHCAKRWLLTWSILSILDDECSGPAPSKPCGRRRIIPLCLSHFADQRISEFLVKPI